MRAVTLDSFRGDKVAEQKRQFFRLEYPPLDRPKLLLMGRSYEVMDLSENGIRFAATDPINFPVNSALIGSIVFHDGTTAPVTGLVLRVQPHQVIAELRTGVSLAVMMNEQRRLIQKYNWQAS